MVPHLRWPGCNDKRVNHYFVFASILEFQEIRLLHGVANTDVDDQLQKDHAVFIASAKNLGLASKPEHVPRNYKYFHIVLNPHMYHMASSIQDLFYVNISSPLLAIPDEFQIMFQKFLDRYKPIKHIDCSLEEYALLGNRPAHWKAH